MLNIIKFVTVCSVLAASLSVGITNAHAKRHHRDVIDFGQPEYVVLESQCEKTGFNLPRTLMVKPGAMVDVSIRSSLLFRRGSPDPYLYESDYSYNQVYGKLLLDTHWICQVKQDGLHPTLWLVPSIVTTSGSGAFNYLGVYQKEGEHFSVIQELFLGDRIEIESLSLEGGVVNLSFKQHALEQAMSDEPNELIGKKFSIIGTQLFEQRD
ncbi:hypothetical protein FCV82_10495 [Vibrio breoganii]|uniref:Uncharacterized protein n=1 Tax=Vibrio breoganii TaxID=553239 RepID=A0AAP8MV47_9VIBR|nr:hypothetical protein [Vibrio breoganii]NMO73365.1 hypothetical protein [Vibrio breoganii]NMR69465.1 hypothetical protein [Vibrio breoganii]PMG02781.1 hypothetical protein BCV02_10510 [Vibrio breoganii]PML87902.1 hypothetical protein BCT67_00885 [Vibrio breoganii]PMP09276.1 hypothetical protein BCS93_12780 [Vibrio breoganii]